MVEELLHSTQKGKKEKSNDTRSSECIIHHMGENNLSQQKRFDVKYNKIAFFFSDETEREGDWFNIREDATE